MAENTRFEYLVGLHVTDEEGYAQYRAGMTPILAEHGGRFRYDVRGGEVLQSETAEVINRVFVISFPSREAADRFYANEDYQRVRDTHFDPAVAAVTLMANYECAVTD